MGFRYPTLEVIAEDIIGDVSEADKANVTNTPEDELAMFYQGWHWHTKSL